MTLQHAQERLEWARRELETLEQAEALGRLSSFDGGTDGRTGRDARLKMRAAVNSVRYWERQLDLMEKQEWAA